MALNIKEKVPMLSFDMKVPEMSVNATVYSEAYSQQSGLPTDIQPCFVLGSHAEIHFK